MSTETTRKMLRVYEQMARPVLFLSGLFSSPPENFHTSEEVEFDIVRSDEEVAIVVTDMSTGHRMNSEDLYTNKSFKPPVYKEAIPLSSFDLIKRMPGQDPFQEPNFRANLIHRIFKGVALEEAKIRRAFELQASQVLQTGTVSLTDKNGVPLYVLDYKPKATHFPTAGVSWATATGAQKLNDINSLAEVIRNDGLEDPDQLIMGIDAFTNFIADETVQKQFDNRNIYQGTFGPMEMRGNGGTYRGIVEIGNYKYDVWTYGGRYNHPQTTVKTMFIEPGNVIVRSSQGRLDATFGAIPNIAELLGVGSAKLLPELPGRLSSSQGGMDLFVNAWLSENGEQIFAGVGARPLAVPTAIDTYGCIATQL